MKKFISTFCLGLFLATITFAQQDSTSTNAVKSNAEVISVYDGDSYSVLMDGQKKVFSIRLWGADAPEKKSIYVANVQAYGPQAADSMRLMLKGKRIFVDTLYRDVYNRRIAKVQYGHQDLTTYVISKGFAWYYPSKGMTRAQRTFYANLQKTAQSNKVGLWGLDGEKIKPSDFRKQNKVKK